VVGMRGRSNLAPHIMEKDEAEATPGAAITSAISERRRVLRVVMVFLKLR